MAAYLEPYSSAFLYVLANEGGATYTNSPSDRGGPTKFGVSLATLAAWRTGQGKPVPAAADVAALTQDEAQAIYYALYWLKMGCPSVKDAAVATVLFDAAVLTGPTAAGKRTQQVLNDAGQTGLKLDGAVGAKTLAALNACPRRPFIEGFVGGQQGYFLDIVLADRTQLAFHRTWRRRAADYLGLVP